MQRDDRERNKDAATPRRGRRRLFMWLGSGVAVVGLLFVLVVFVLPTPLARYMIHAEFDSLGIENAGVDTIDIDIWNSAVRAGPVRFHSGDAREGQIGDVAFDYSFNDLLNGRAFIQTFHLRGVDVHVTRHRSGDIAFNGISLAKLAPPREPREGAGSEETAEAAEAPGFGFGVEAFEFADSQLVFEDYTGAVAAIELEKLTLETLHSWDPDDPTSIRFDGLLNGIRIAVDGEVSPLGDPVRVALNSRLDGVTIERIARFVRPTGLARQDGTLSTDVKYRYAIHKSGRIEGTVDGAYSYRDFDIETEAGERFTLGQALVQVDLEQVFRPNDSVSTSGGFSVRASPITLAGAEGQSVELGALALNFDDLGFEKLADRRQRDGGAQAGRAADEAAGETVPTIIDLMIGWARELTRQTLRHHLEINGRPTLTLEDVRLTTAGRDGQPGQQAAFDRLDIDLGQVTSQTLADGWRMNTALDAALAGMRAAADAGAEATAAEVRARAQSIDLARHGRDTSLDFDLNATAQNLTAADGQGARLALGGIDIGTDGFRIIDDPDGDAAQGSIALAVDGIEATLPGPDGTLSVRGDRLGLRLSPLGLSGRETLGASLSGTIEADALALRRDGPEPLAFDLASGRSELRDTRVAPLGPDAAVTGGAATSLSGLRFAMGEGSAAVSLSVEAVRNSVGGLDASGFGDAAPKLTMATETELDGIAASLPMPGGDAVAAKVANVKAPLTELALAGPRVRVAGGLEAGGIAAEVQADPPQALGIGHLAVTGLAADSDMGAEAESVAVENLVGSLNLPLPVGRPEPEGGGESTDGGGDATAAPARHFKVGNFSISSGSRIDLSDKTVDPPVRLGVVLEEVRAGPLDTASPESRTNLALSGTLNESTRIDLEGWASPLKPDPDLEIVSRVESLSLPAFSSYAAKATGVEIESGALTADLNANAASGVLQGGIDLLIDDLFVAPVSQEKAQALQADFGVPLGFAVGILKNDEGRIDLGFPLSGTLDSPELDYSEAISKAIAGAMAAVFPTSWFGEGGNTFEIQAATFVPGTSELTPDGRDVADHMGKLFADKPDIRIRACGRAGLADLLVLREQEPAAEAAGEEAPASGEPKAGGEAEAGGEPEASVAEATADAQRAEVAPPTEDEVEALLSLASQRGAAIRGYLARAHGVESDRVPECRTSYSIKNRKPPRAEFQF